MVNIFSSFNRLFSVMITGIIFVCSYYFSVAFSRTFGISELFFACFCLSLISLISEKLLVLQIIIEAVVVLTAALVKYFMNVKEFTTLAAVFQGYFEVLSEITTKFMRHFRYSLNLWDLKTGLILCVVFLILRVVAAQIMPEKEK